MVRTRTIRQGKLFEDSRAEVGRVLPEELRDEVRQILTQWLYTLGERMVQEGSDE
jgi:hypothetical protein